MTTKTCAGAWLWIALAATRAAAAAPVPMDEYAWRFPLHLDAGAQVHVLTLTPEVYRSVSDADLRDLRLVTAEGEEVSFGLLATADRELWREMPWALQREAVVFQPMPSLEAGELDHAHARSRDGDFGLSLARGEYAAWLSMRLTSNAVETVPIVALRVNWSSRAALPEPTRWWIVDPDTGEAIYPERSNQRYDISQSKGETRLAFSGIDLRSFELHGQAVPSGLNVEQVYAEYAPDPERYRYSTELATQNYPDPPADAYGFIAEGPFPVHAAEIELADSGIATVRLLGRDIWTPHWQEIGSTTAFDLTVDNTSLLRNRIGFHPTRQRQWLLRSTPALIQAPRLRMYYQPDRFLIAHSGPADLFLLAGHRRLTRPSYPVDTVMTELRARFGDRWTPRSATIGLREQIRGREALVAPPPPRPYRQWLLWGLLITAAAIIAMMALGLLREKRTSDRSGP